MGKRGPQPVPTAILQERGSWRGDKRATTEAPSIDGIPTAPSFLQGEAKRCWNRRVQTLQKQLVLSETYRESLAIYCQAWGEFYETTKAIKERGGILSHIDVIDDESGEVLGQKAYADKEVKDLLMLRKQAYETLLKIGPQFGWSPTSKVDVKKSSPAPTTSTKKPASDKQQEARRFTSAEDFGIVG